MSDLVNHVQAVTFRNFEESISNGKCFHMSSFGESKAEEFFRDPSASIHFVKYNVKQISRYTGMSYWWNECWVLTVAMIRDRIKAIGYRSCTHLFMPMFVDKEK